MNRNKSIILMYHGVSGEKDFRGLVNHSGMQLTAARFDGQMKFMKDHYKVISLGELVDLLRNGEPIPPSAAAITFDDGYANNYTQAYPILKKYGLPATLFLSTHHIGRNDLFWPDRLEILFDSIPRFPKIYSIFDKSVPSGNSLKERLESTIRFCKRISEKEKESLIASLEYQCAFDPPSISQDYRALTWTQISEMRASGLVEVGSHTHDHVIMTRVGHERAREEIVRSKDLIKEHLGTEPRLFSYPNGCIGDYDETTHDLLREEGFECAFLTLEGLNGRSPNLFEMKRIGIHNAFSLLEFEARLSGFYFFIKKILRIKPELSCDTN
jgi:peptidoglycan/xylan/chitin deacetylase (PgdA/CDA1 family)